MKKYRVGGGKKPFSLEEAKAFAEAHFQRSGVVLAIEEVAKKLTAKQAKRLAEARINRAIIGFQIPMLSIPKLYKALEDAVASGVSDEDLKAVVAGFPGVKPSI